MKKVLSVFCLAVVLCMGMPANAAPHGGHGGPGGPRPDNHVIAGPHRTPHYSGHGHNWGAPPPPPPPRHYYGGSRVVVGGVLARPCYGYSSYYDYRLGWYEPCYYPRYRNGMYVNVGFPIRF